MNHSTLQTLADSANLMQRIRQAPPSKACLVSDGRTLSYGDLCRYADLIAADFERRAWVAGTRLVIVTQNDHYALCLMMAALQAGLVPLIADPEARATEAMSVLVVAKIGAAVIDDGLLATWPLEAHHIPCWPLPKQVRESGGLYQRLLNRKKAPSSDWFTQLDALPKTTAATQPSAAVLPTKLMFFTSGSTSSAKAVELSLSAVEAHLATLQRQFGYNTDSRILNVLPWNHADGLIQGAFNVLWSQASLYRPMKFRIESVQRLLDAMYADRITHVVAVPTMLAIILKLADALKDAFSATELKVVISTAGHLETELWRGFEARFAVQISNVYGLTETVAGALFSGPGGDTRRVGTLGKPVDCLARIVNAEGADVAAGDPGELWLRGANCMTCYFDDPEATDAALTDGWLRTGDRVHVDADGFYHFDGRIKNTLVSGGHNIQPEEVTTVLKQFATVADAATIGMPHPELEEVPVSAVVAVQGSVIDMAALEVHCRQHLADYKQPRTILVLAEMPYGPSGKVRIEALRALMNAPVRAAMVSSEQDIEQQVLALAAANFHGSKNLSLQSSPDVTPGWDSIAHLGFVLSLERHFKIELLPRHIIALTSLAAAVRVVRSIRDE